MSNYNYAPGAIHIDHHKDLNIDVKSVDDAVRLMSAFMSDRAEDITPVQEEKPDTIDSIIFTKKAKKEAKEAIILQALQKSVQGRNDKARALVEEVRQWQKEGYIDPNYNARVMYDELNKIITIPFQYDGFRKYYNE